MFDDSVAISAQSDAALREKLISESIEFILSKASKASGRWIDIHDDLYSEALIAFNSAIDSYSPEKGHFLSFADKIITNKMIDCLRKEKAHRTELPWSYLSAIDDSGEELPFDIEDAPDHSLDIKCEITAFDAALKKYQISFAELPEVSPKTNKSKKECRRAVRFIISHGEITTSVKRSQKIPVATLMRELGINKKILERYRKYIIAGVVICTGDFPTLNEYFWG